jgi:hypothetical protein
VRPQTGAIAPAAKRKIGRRPTKAEMEARFDAIFDIVEEINPCGVRQSFYQTSVRGLLDKTEADYDKVQRALVAMRRSGRVPYGWIVDGTRWMHKPASYGSLEQALRRTAQTYRRAIWDEQDVRVEFWLEKEGLAGTILPVTAEYDVPLYVSRGFSSITYLSEAADDIREADKSTYIYHLGDHDPSGVAAGEHIRRELYAMAPDADIVFTRLALTIEQIADLGLPTRPTKDSDSRAAKFRERFGAAFGGASVELDAIHPDTLRHIVRRAIERHVDFELLEVLKVAEQPEREILKTFRRRE